MRKINTLVAATLLLLAAGAGCAPLAFPTSPPVSPPETFTSVPPASVTPAPAEAATSTPEPFLLDLTPLPTATALPPLVLPTRGVLPHDMQVWDGLPTYPGESRPDFYFRLHYDPIDWALTTDQFGTPVLAGREMRDCILGTSAGRGLPLGGSVAHEVRRIGSVTFQVSTASMGGTRRFVNYTGGDGTIYTAFELTFEDEAEACIAAAEAVLGTLGSVPAFEATPVTEP
jgi:hypothetical protein